MNMVENKFVDARKKEEIKQRINEDPITEEKRTYPTQYTFGENNIVYQKSINDF